MGDEAATRHGRQPRYPMLDDYAARHRAPGGTSTPTDDDADGDAAIGADVDADAHRGVADSIADEMTMIAHHDGDRAWRRISRRRG